jgi:hypothetical protein
MNFGKLEVAGLSGADFCLGCGSTGWKPKNNLIDLTFVLARDSGAASRAYLEFLRIPALQIPLF